MNVGDQTKTPFCSVSFQLSPEYLSEINRYSCSLRNKINAAGNRDIIQY